MPVKYYVHKALLVLSFILHTSAKHCKALGKKQTKEPCD